MWPDYMKRETLAKRMDITPAYVDQLVKRGYIPPPHKIGEALMWSWVEVDSFIRAGKVAEIRTNGDDPFTAGAIRAAEAATVRQARQKPDR